MTFSIWIRLAATSVFLFLLTMVVIQATEDDCDKWIVVVAAVSAALAALTFTVSVIGIIWSV